MHNFGTGKRKYALSVILFRNNSRWLNITNSDTTAQIMRISALEEITMPIRIRVSTKDRLIKYGFMQNIGQKKGLDTIIATLLDLAESY